MTSSSVSSHGGAKIREMDGKGGRCVWEVLNCDSTGRRAAGELVYMSRCNSMRTHVHVRARLTETRRHQWERRGRGRPINIY